MTNNTPAPSQHCYRCRHWSGAYANAFGQCLLPNSPNYETRTIGNNFCRAFQERTKDARP